MDSTMPIDELAKESADKVDEPAKESADKVDEPAKEPADKVDEPANEPAEKVDEPADDDTDTDSEVEKVAKKINRRNKENLKKCGVCEMHMNSSDRTVFRCPCCNDERCKSCIKNAIIKDVMENKVTRLRCVTCNEEFADELITATFEGVWQEKELRKAFESIVDVSYITGDVLNKNLDLAEQYCKVREQMNLYAANPVARNNQLDDEITIENAKAEMMFVAIGETKQMALRANIIKTLANVKGIQEAMRTVSKDEIAPSTRDRIASAVIRSKGGDYEDDIKQEACKLKEDLKVVRARVEQKKAMLRFVKNQNNTPANIMAMARKLHVNSSAASSEVSAAPVPLPTHNPEYDSFMKGITGMASEGGADAKPELNEIMANVKLYMTDRRVQHFKDSAAQHRKDCELVACQFYCKEFDESKLRTECYAIERTKLFFEEQDQAAHHACLAAQAIIGCSDAGDKLSEIANYFNRVLDRLSKKFNNRCTYVISPVWDIATRSSSRKRNASDAVTDNQGGNKRQAVADDTARLTVADAIMKLMEDPINMERFKSSDDATRMEMLADIDKMTHKHANVAAPATSVVNAVAPATSVVTAPPATSAVTVDADAADADATATISVGNGEVNMTGNPLFEKAA
jgi:hypothetical protein